uniref:Adenylate kinase isoenzyme 6 homolog n=1 Tax=Rhizochromulina marina TaxID=1034831 RepID=A0A7S2SS55_9STRA|eukprot:CAMPEP_0118961556 /NCGR_PEP_ID=MMETSP1173-20130426/198_1 /TAXON_ID=1034831 /ORGANISM="Rhizochromulina marina cf, Strain CCMP1243" /LENGTH=181 /DNA_ID=CAMNT_0006909733 /DNA_START=35 /DNA_END=580 /DNA_ORIENTATION=+
MAARSLPNVLVTGTPGTGKTATASLIAEKTELQHLEVSELVKREECHEGWDEDRKSHIIDEDKLLDAMEPLMEQGGQVVDFHGCDLFPERWFDLILVLRCNNTSLFDRLSERGYSATKVSENVECEIMQVILEEARESFPVEIVHEVQSESIEDMDSNVGRVAQWLEQWKVDRTAASASSD